MLGIVSMIDYTAAAETYDNTRTHSDKVIDRFCAAASLDASASILDFGCGTGNYLSQIYRRFGCRCYGVEPSDAMRSQALSKPGLLQIVKGDHLAIPFPSEIFDFGYMTDVIHHVPDLRSMFRELLRVLKASGLLCIVTESHSQIDARFYNRYFPSLAANEKRRYPDIEEVSARAGEIGFCAAATEAVSSPTGHISEGFLRNVAERNWSMFRLLSEDEFSHGLQALQRDRGRSFESPVAGETLVWFRKVAQPCAGGNPAPPRASA
ncbi:MAG TPA: class I SAM-dependent methyltransferase [Verrucomicrobiae bacterium]|nr:class I SAM-dependent methyltransferase [Verrucomicrobiae bacterium]